MVEIVWLGHGSFELTLESGEVILIDPWVTGNPKYPAGHKIDRVDAILITHGHFDHTADVVRLAKEFSAPVVAIHEIGEWLATKGVTTARGKNKGGTQQVGSVAIHSSSVTENGQIVYLDEAAGFVLTFADGRSAYFAGDTTGFGDMALIEELYKPELAFLPIGDHYTISPPEAAVACHLVKAKSVFPMHWGTFPALTGTPPKLAELVKDQTEVHPVDLHDNGRRVFKSRVGLAPRAHRSLGFCWLARAVRTLSRLTSGLPSSALPTASASCLSHRFLSDTPDIQAVPALASSLAPSSPQASALVVAAPLPWGSLLNSRPEPDFEEFGFG